MAFAAIKALNVVWSAYSFFTLSWYILQHV